MGSSNEVDDRLDEAERRVEELERRVDALEDYDEAERERKK